MASLNELTKLSGHADRVWSLSWSPCGTAFASCSSDLSVIIWKTDCSDIQEALNTKTEIVWQKTQTIRGDHKKTIRSVSWCPTGKRIATASFDGTVIIYQLIEGMFEAVATLEGHENEVKWVSWNSAGDMIATCSRDKTIWIWQEDGDGEWECVSVLTGHTQDVKQVRFFRENMLLSASYDDTVKIWKEDEDDWYNEHTLSGHSSTVWSLTFDSTKKYILTSSSDCSVGLYQYTPPAPGSESTSSINDVWKKLVILPNLHDRPIYSVDWSAASDHFPHGVIATAGGADDIVLLRPVFEESSEKMNLQVLCSVKAAHQNDINSIVFNPKYPTLVVTGSDDAKIKLWQVMTSSNEMK